MTEPVIQGRPLRPAEHHLTPLYGFETECLIDQTMAGMAHFAGTGPSARRCGECMHYGYERKHHEQDPVTGQIETWEEHCNGCRMYKQLTGRYGPALPSATLSCRHFVLR